MNEPRRSRWQCTDGPRGADYDARWSTLDSPHGEADFVMSFSPRSVLDAGCGTGRVAIELATRGVAAVGFDLDPDMLQTARRKAPSLRWVEADAATIDLRGDNGGFDAVVLAGNVMIFLEPGSESTVIDNMARHLEAAGVLITGFSLRPDRYGLSHLDADAGAAGLELVERWSTWDRRSWSSASDYAVSVFSPGE